ncbi:MAG: GNVR domain-containing protein, partial [Arcobacteraceae bacterium]|nr:GNVR domain-containing protein [Arcobacteraceae bacterium]
NFEKLNIANKRAMNSKVIGDIIANDYPIKPKKSLIIIVSFVTGVVLSIFIVLLYNFFREEKIKKTEG